MKLEKKNRVGEHLYNLLPRESNHPTIYTINKELLDKFIVIFLRYKSIPQDVGFHFKEVSIGFQLIHVSQNTVFSYLS